ncbi:MAG: PEP/pyruvate-binding domain-containing protein, partial [Planctomycetota bacterium]
MATKTTKKSTRKPAARMPKMVYYFGKTKTDGNAKQKELLGGKGANLADMTSIGLPVPAGFTCTTECCDQYYKQGRKLPAGLMDQVHKAVKTLEK